LHRGRSANAVPEIALQAKARTLELGFPKEWLDTHPLTAADLEQEVEYLKGIGFKLRFA